MTPTLPPQRDRSVPAKIIVLRKRKMIRQLLITRAGGEIKFARFSLPSSALFLSGVRVSARHIEVDEILIATLTYYFGKVADNSIDAQQVAALTPALYVDTNPVWTVSAGPGEYLYYAHPISLSDPVFSYQGFQGGFLDHGTVNLTTATGLQTYRVWRSTNPNLGANVTVTASH